MKEKCGGKRKTSKRNKKGGMESLNNPENVSSSELSKGLLESENGLKIGDIFKISEENGYFKVIDYLYREGDNVYLKAEKIEEYYLPIYLIFYNLADNKYSYIRRARPNSPYGYTGGGSKKNIKRRKTQKKGGMDSLKKPIAFRPKSPNSLLNQYIEASTNHYSHLEPEERMKLSLRSLPHDPVNRATFRKAYMRNATIEEDIANEIEGRSIIEDIERLELLEKMKKEREIYQKTRKKKIKNNKKKRVNFNL